MTDISGTLLLVIEIVAPIVLLAALIYGTMVWRRSRPGAVAPELRDDASPERNVTPAVSHPAPSRTAERVTEDEQARAALGGTRGAPELGEAPLVPQQEKKMPRNVEPGHVA
jgi:hypothetical protein